MYIKKLEIKNIRSITEFTMNFSKPAGWHVLIGDNGAGKSTIIRSISLGLIGAEEGLGLRANWRDWLSLDASRGSIDLNILRHPTYDKNNDPTDNSLSVRSNVSFLNRQGRVLLTTDTSPAYFVKEQSEENMIFGQDTSQGWFSAAFGPYRRFAGGNPDWAKVFSGQPKLGAHLSAFGEDVALTEATEWLMKLYFQSLEEGVKSTSKEAANLIEDFKKLINSANFLPHQARLHSISSEGVKFKDGNDNLINIDQMSDGYRSILSLTFELIRHMIDIFGSKKVFKHIRKNQIFIDLPGVVVIDEIDAHLHPTWQTRIGEWFTSYFPKIQFIVTTHSPLICRAAKDGTIWRLTNPGSSSKSAQIEGLEKDRLVLGNVLDAYGTEIFGAGVSISKEADEKLSRIAALNMKSIMGDLTNVETVELNSLKAIFPTETLSSK